MIRPERKTVAEWEASIPDASRRNLRQAAGRIIDAKRRGGSVVVVTGSGPNIHEGVTTLIAELMKKGVVDGVITSSAVVGHEMAGTLDRVKRVVASAHPDLGLPSGILPRGGGFEITLLSEAQRAQLESEIDTHWDLYDRIAGLSGDVIIKAAGNMAWPMGPRTESLAREAELLAQEYGLPLETVVGLGADPMTMIGMGARRNLPVIVSTPQLVGSGAVGLAIGDSISITQRARIVSSVLAGADVIIESAIALSQEIHDGPFELYTGHGIWSAWQNGYSYSLEGKTLVRIDLDPNLERAWLQERQSSQIQQAVDRGLPKTKLTGIPFRMEMSGFARLEGSLPVTADIGVVWPVLAVAIEEGLGLRLDFVSAPQETPEGQQMREWITANVQPVDRQKLKEELRRRQARSQQVAG
jgi:hypothetical protein